ncbi:MAG: glycosyltransferase family 2 protein [Candidatus Solibacter usitatus]|nr:glycosyltransferase family 2 protein [Candidatus Solibacter usitatus]
MSASIVIVTFNSEGHIGACLDACLAHCAPDETVLVVDNASQDATLEEVRRRGVALIANPENRGFAGAVNQGVRASSSDLILLLNPDAVLETGLDPLRRACAQSGVAGAGGKLVDGNRAVQAGFTVRRLPTATALLFEVLGINRLWPGNPVNWHYRCCDLDLEKPGRVEQPAGALLMFRREVWQEIGGFDETFFPLWFEDVDFCRRASDRGYSWSYIPSVVARHAGGHSLVKISLEQRQLYWYGSLLRYSSKHFRPWSHWVVCFGILVGSVARMVAGCSRSGASSPLQCSAG